MVHIRSNVECFARDELLSKDTSSGFLLTASYVSLSTFGHFSQGSTYSFSSMAVETVELLALRRHILDS